MTVTVHQVHLFNVERGEPVPAELRDAITEQQIADWENKWRPELLKAIKHLEREGIERRHWPQSRYWDWRESVPALLRDDARTGAGLYREGKGKMKGKERRTGGRDEDENQQRVVHPYGAA